MSARRSVLAALAALLALHLAWPGDIPFINDEPSFVGKAFVANESGRLADKGLLGTFGVEYAPAAIWIYQLLLVLTKDLVLLAVLKTALTWTVVGLAMHRVLSVTRLSPWPLLLIPVSPFLWLLSRILWDNVFLVPVSAAMVATVAAFLAKPRTGLFALWAALAVLAFHVHVMAAVPIAACAIAMALFRREWLLAHRGRAAAVALAALAASARFLYAIVAERGEAGHVHPSLGHTLDGTTHGFLLWSHAGFEFFVASFYRDLPAASFLQSIPGWLALAGGVAALAGFVAVSIRSRLPLREWPLDRQLAALAALIVIGQVALFLALRLEPYWHYFSAAWLGYFYLLWWGFDRVKDRAWARALLGAQVLTVGLLTLLVAWHVHAHHGDRTRNYGATLGNQLEVARRIVERKPKDVVQRVDNYLAFPHALQVLVALEAARAGTVIANPSGKAVVEYAGTSPDDGRIGIVFEE